MNNIWTKKDERFIRNNYYKVTNQDLSTHFGVKLWQIRAQCISMGLKRMEMEYWTPQQVQHLKRHYKTKGDKEIAEMFEEKWPKGKRWTLKHIEKKRNYLGLHRTKKEIKAIRRRNIALGCWANAHKWMWATRGVTPVGGLKQWGPYTYIKARSGHDGYERLTRYTWERHYGKIPKGMNVVRKNPLLPEDEITNLVLLTDSQLGARNSITRYPYELRQTIMVLNKLKRVIDEKQNE